MGEERATEATFVEHDDVPGLEAWARAICKDATVEQLASMLRVVPTIEAIEARLAGHLPKEGSEAVVRVCRAELRGKDDVELR